MRLAQTEAQFAYPASAPNPAVGCVLVDARGVVIGRGHTQPPGQPHAEVMALRAAQAAGHAAEGATAYVTLEPCAHQGRTGPCCDALIAAGVTRVVAAIGDPNPQVAGQGFARLRAAGVAVLVGPGAAASRELNLGFFSRMKLGRPWVRLKAAASLDGRTALPNRESRWITSEVAREDGRNWRARAGAVLSGIGTVLQDDPLLNVRLPGTTNQPLLALVDSRLRTPPTAALWQVVDRPVVIYCAAEEPSAARRLRDLGSEVLALPDPDGQVDLLAMLRDLARREVNEVHVEAGGRLNGALFARDLVDELLLYQAPLLMGEGVPVATLGPFAQLQQAVRLDCRAIDRLGPDLRIRCEVAGHARALE